MEKKIAVSYSGTLSQVGDLEVKRYLPNRYTRTVGSFFFLDYILPNQINPSLPKLPDGNYAHAHRGIATFTYLFSGELEHFDSRGHHGIVGAGGAQWMKAGNGIIHDENASLAFQQKGGLLHGMQFWINLPAFNKAQEPEYMAIQHTDFPVINFPNNAGTLKVLIGSYENITSPIPTYLRQFNFHLQLQAKATFTLNVNPDFETAAFTVTENIFINGSKYHAAELLVFEIESNEIVITNAGDETASVMLFGGEGYNEPIVAEGPYVMNSESEIGLAYRDFYNGKYGEIKYS